MSAALPAAAAIIAASALVLSCVILFTTRSARIAVQVLLDLLLAASLLRLGATGSWPATAGAVAVIGIRTTLTVGLSRNAGVSSA